LYDGHRAIWLQEFDPAARKLVGPRTVIVNGGVDPAKKPVWIEGPHLYRHDGWYYLCAAEGGTGDYHSEVVFRSRQVTGPFLPWDRNPILTQRDLDGAAPAAVTSTGHADMVVGPDGRWWSVFLGCRPFAGGYYATGRETFMLPVTWTDDGWPRILPPGERVPYVVPGPKAKEEASSAAIGKGALGSTGSTVPGRDPLTGNFTWRDEFDGAALSPLWVMLRCPRDAWWRLADGKLSLTPRPDVLSAPGQPAFLGRRLQHARFEAGTSLAVPAGLGVSAGLVAFQNETHHYFLGVRQGAAGAEIFLERLAGQPPEKLASRPIGGSGPVQLRIVGADKNLEFSYATKPGEWQVLMADADATVLTTQAAGGFVGAMVGVHARVDP
jgi:alpha-N-arabinofuranosidase